MLMVDRVMALWPLPAGLDRPEVLFVRMEQPCLMRNQSFRLQNAAAAPFAFDRCKLGLVGLVRG